MLIIERPNIPPVILKSSRFSFNNKKSNLSSLCGLNFSSHVLKLVDRELKNGQF